MKVDVIQKTRHDLPKYESVRSAGADVRAELGGTPHVNIYPGNRRVIPTGLYVAIPEGYEIQVRPRSGLAAKHGITVVNSPGTIDADYRGEIGVIIINHGDEMFTVNDGDRIGQLVLNKVEQIEWNQVSKLDDTDRGEGGYGSTGNK